MTDHFTQVLNNGKHVELYNNILKFYELKGIGYFFKGKMP
jgi:hypothetical protein